MSTLLTHNLHSRLEELHTTTCKLPNAPFQWRGWRTEGVADAGCRLEAESDRDAANHEAPVHKGQVDLTLHILVGVSDFHRREAIQSYALAHNAEGGCSCKLPQSESTNSSSWRK